MFYKSNITRFIYAKINIFALKNKRVYFTKTPGIIKKFSSPHLVWDLPNREKKVFLTFDDGPVPGVTPEVINILDSYKVKATFFCVGHNVVKYPDIFQMVKSAGHQIGNHTFNHLNGWQTPAKQYVENIEKCTVHFRTNLFRPPYGRIKNKQTRRIRDNYKIIMWSVLAGDFDHNNTPEKCVDNILKNTREGSILVFHDSLKARGKVLYALPVVIESLFRIGFRFEPIIF